MHGSNQRHIQICSVYAWGSADSHVSAAGPQRSVEHAGPHPLCHSVHGHFLGVPRGAATTLLPAVLETMGPLPDTRGGLCSDRGMFVHFCRDRGQLLLHTLAVAHPGGQLCCLPAAAEGEGQGGVGLEQGLELELELETPGLWIHALSEQQG